MKHIGIIRKGRHKGMSLLKWDCAARAMIMRHMQLDFVFYRELC